MLYSKSNLNVSNIPNRQDKMNGSYMYLKKINSDTIKKYIIKNHNLNVFVNSQVKSSLNNNIVNIHNAELGKYVNKNGLYINNVVELKKDIIKVVNKNKCIYNISNNEESSTCKTKSTNFEYINKCVHYINKDIKYINDKNISYLKNNGNDIVNNVMCLNNNLSYLNKNIYNKIYNNNDKNNNNNSTSKIDMSTQKNIAEYNMHPFVKYQLIWNVKNDIPGNKNYSLMTKISDTDNKNIENTGEDKHKKYNILKRYHKKLNIKENNKNTNIQTNDIYKIGQKKYIPINNKPIYNLSLNNNHISYDNKECLYHSSPFFLNTQMTMNNNYKDIKFNNYGKKEHLLVQSSEKKHTSNKCVTQKSNLLNKTVTQKSNLLNKNVTQKSNLLNKNVTQKSNLLNNINTNNANVVKVSHKGSSDNMSKENLNNFNKKTEEQKEKNEEKEENKKKTNKNNNHVISDNVSNDNNIISENVSNDNNIINENVSYDNNIINVVSEEDITKDGCSKESNKLNDELTQKCNNLNEECIEECNKLNDECKEESKDINDECKEESKDMNDECKEEGKDINDECTEESKDIKEECKIHSEKLKEKCKDEMNSLKNTTNKESDMVKDICKIESHIISEECKKESEIIKEVSITERNIIKEIHNCNNVISKKTNNNKDMNMLKDIKKKDTYIMESKEKNNNIYNVSKKNKKKDYNNNINYVAQEKLQHINNQSKINKDIISDNKIYKKSSKIDYISPEYISQVIKEYHNEGRKQKKNIDYENVKDEKGTTLCDKKNNSYLFNKNEKGNMHNIRRKNFYKYCKKKESSISCTNEHKSINEDANLKKIKREDHKNKENIETDMEISQIVNIVAEDKLDKCHLSELIKIMKKLEKVHMKNMNIDNLILEGNCWEDFIKSVEGKNKVKYKGEDKIKDKVKDKDKINDKGKANVMSLCSNNYNVNNKNKKKHSEIVYNKKTYYTKNKKNINNMYHVNDDNNDVLYNVYENIMLSKKKENLIELNKSDSNKVSLINNIKNYIDVLNLSFDELIHLKNVKDIFWYLYIKSKFVKKQNMKEFCEVIKDKMDDKIHKNYFMEYVDYESFKKFNKNNFDTFEEKIYLLENLFYLLKSYPLDYDENKGCFYMLYPQKNKMFKNSEYDIIKNKLHHLKISKDITEHFKNNFFFLDKIFIPKDAFFFVKDSEDIGLRDKDNNIIYIHQALVSDLKEDVNDKSIFDNLYSSSPSYKSDYFRYIQKKKIQNKIRKFKEYILYYYEFRSVQDFFDLLILFDEEYKNLEMLNSCTDIPYNLTKRLYTDYCNKVMNIIRKNEEPFHNIFDNLNNINIKNNMNKYNVFNNDEQNGMFVSNKLCNKESDNIKRIHKDENFNITKRYISLENSENNYNKKSNINEKDDKANNNRNLFCSRTRDSNIWSNKFVFNKKDCNINKYMLYEKYDPLKKYNNKKNNSCNIDNSSSMDSYFCAEDLKYEIEEMSDIYLSFFYSNDNKRKMKEITLDTFKLFVENLGKIKGLGKFTCIDECFLGITFCDPDIPKHLCNQKKVLPKNINYNGFMYCMRYIPYVIPDFPLSTSHFEISYNNVEIFNSRNSFLHILKYRGNRNDIILLRNKIVLDIIELFVYIPWNFGVDTGIYTSLVHMLPEGKRTVDMCESSYYKNYKYYLKRNKKYNNMKSFNMSSDNFSDSNSTSTSNYESNNFVSRICSKEYNKRYIVGDVEEEKISKIKERDILHLNDNIYNMDNSLNSSDNNNISFEETFLKMKKKLSYKWIPKWHMCNDIFLSRLISYDEIQICLQKIFPLYLIQTALIYMVHISCCFLTNEEWKYFFESPFTLYKKLTPEDIATRYIKLKGYKFNKVNNIQINKNIDIHQIFMSIPENMQCPEIYKLAINGENTSSGYLAEPFDIYHLMFICKVFWYIFLYADNFVIVRSTLFKKKPTKIKK